MDARNKTSSNNEITTLILWFQRISQSEEMTPAQEQDLLRYYLTFQFGNGESDDSLLAKQQVLVV